MRHYYILTTNPQLSQVLDYIHANNLDFELHINRTRFWVPEGPVLTDFLLRFADCCSIVDEHADLVTGLVGASDC